MAILDVHPKIAKLVFDPDEVGDDNPSGVVEQALEVTEDDLRRIAANSNAQVAAGRPPALTLGHRPLEDMPEEWQPKGVGYTSGFTVGDLDGRACLFADLHCQAAQYQEASTFSNLSVERVDWRDPSAHRVDAVALLRRAPERSLPRVPYSAGAKPPRVLYSRDLPYPPAFAVRHPEIATADADLAYSVAARTGVSPIAAYMALKAGRLRDQQGRILYADDARPAVIIPEPDPSRPDRPTLMEFATKRGIFNVNLARKRYAEAIVAGLI